jgi:hypothetical protein
MTEIENLRKYLPSNSPSEIYDSFTLGKGKKAVRVCVSPNFVVMRKGDIERLRGHFSGMGLCDVLRGERSEDDEGFVYFEVSDCYHMVLEKLKSHFVKKEEMPAKPFFAEENYNLKSKIMKEVKSKFNPSKRRWKNYPNI